MRSRCISLFILFVWNMPAECISDYMQKGHEDETVSPARQLRGHTSITWGRTFPGLESTNVAMNCMYDGKPLCCSVCGPISPAPPPTTLKVKTDQLESKCETSRIYEQSDYEKSHFLKAKELTALHNLEHRRTALLSFIVSDEQVRQANNWLARVKLRMNTSANWVGGVENVNEDDTKYLSRFVVTRKCGSSTNEWIEWIEPLSIHFRHPFAFEDLDNLRHILQHTINFKNIYSKLDIRHVGLINNDYVLLQSAKQSYERHYMFDAGTSSISSSLFWFLCAYGQHGISFDQVYGWELTLLEPTAFWAAVPPRVKSRYHFFNNPINKDSTHFDSPLQIMGCCHQYGLRVLQA